MSGGDEPPPREDEGILLDGLQERLLKKLAKSINAKTQAIVPQIKNKPVTLKKIKNEPITPAKPGTSKIPVPHSKRYKKGNENFLFPHPKSMAQSWNDSKNSVTGNLGKREVTTIKRLKMAKPQSQAKAKAKARTARNKKPITKRPPRRQRGGEFDIQKWISKLGIEFHWPGYQHMGPGTKLAKRVKRCDPGINRLDKLAKHHDIDYRTPNHLATNTWRIVRWLLGVIISRVRRVGPKRLSNVSC